MFSPEAGLLIFQPIHFISLQELFSYLKTYPLCNYYAVFPEQVVADRIISYLCDFSKGFKFEFLNDAPYPVLLRSKQLRDFFWNIAGKDFAFRLH